LKGDQVVQIARLTGCKNFIGKRKKFIFKAFVDLKPMERLEMRIRFEDKNDVRKERGDWSERVKEGQRCEW